MFRKMPFILVGLFVLLTLGDALIPLYLKEILYSFSLSIKTVVVFVLPLIIFSLMFKATATFANSASRIIGVILALVCCSNFVSTFISHYIGIWIYHFNLTMIKPQATSGLVPLWQLKLPVLISNAKALGAGIGVGIIISKLWPKKALTMAAVLETCVNKFLKIFVYFIPFFVAGFIVKMEYDKVVSFIIKDYGTVFLIIALGQLCYLFIAYFLLSNSSLQNLWRNVKNMLPAALSGFSTMSSAASMPLTMLGAENNAHNKAIARAVIPATVNIHLVGDCFAIPILAYAVLKSFGMDEPSLYNYLIFTCYFVLAKFSVAAIPGGGILVMLPILENYLGFNAEMMSLITALYILFDPVITCTNVLGNGAFAKGIDNLFMLKMKDKKVPQYQ